jgi:hypothetical protein
MKAAMVAHVEQARWTMFRASAETVKQAFEEMIKALEDKMLSKTQEILSFVKRDYMSALGGSVLVSSRALPSGHRVARDDVFQKINTGEVAFKRLADPNFGEDDSNPEQDDEGKVGDQDKPAVPECASTEPSEEPTKDANIGATLLPDTAVIDLPIEEASQESFVSPADG